ncbi:ROK family protein [Nitriliruptor alkaliphilus]|uniref:ROK family protein n=1 Tax=Nitriliruptor alkaliphilus TaxID=427918 RepID=UPI000ACE5FBC|nr:ROK family protein [Nitriliruptor alkaliphilus]
MTVAALGVDVGGTKLVAATLTAGGQVIERRRLETPARDADQLVATLRALIDELGGDGLPVGIGVAGLIDPAGRVRYGPNIGVRDLPLADLLRDVAGGEVTLVNDANAAALGEQRAGAGRGRDAVLLFTLGTGVGGGIVLGGQLQEGAHGFGGEVGHLIVEDGGRPCPCGNRGCIEAYASGTAIGLAARDRLVDQEVTTALRDDTELTGRSVTDAAIAGDALAQSVLVDVGRWLGVAAAGLVNVLDPEVILLGGGAARSTAPWIVPAARAALAERVLGAQMRPLPAIELTELGDDAGMIGAGLLALSRAHQPVGGGR